jgi:hypothetical protein
MEGDHTGRDDPGYRESVKQYRENKYAFHVLSPDLLCPFIKKRLDDSFNCFVTHFANIDITKC